mmetsp:Transcript_34161/g.85738  ORF Transcript_34161/g.85738 Transcript_34161/m.85738 type:complete len:203 (+) Transcript_34161:5373-5981(+)
MSAGRLHAEGRSRLLLRPSAAKPACESHCAYSFMSVDSKMRSSSSRGTACSCARNACEGREDLPSTTEPFGCWTQLAFSQKPLFLSRMMRSARRPISWCTVMTARSLKRVGKIVSRVNAMLCAAICSTVSTSVSTRCVSVPLMSCFLLNSVSVMVFMRSPIFFWLSARGANAYGDSLGRLNWCSTDSLISEGAGSHEMRGPT